ncbi:hypothetical protein QKV95_gp071 [Poseidoniales virus YSH_150918]|uniref:Uncharacterized protein n=1 Tax=Poseidoniales virus YSH_150918 TaxID=3071324 RepID=A0A976YF50_9CAUD|nr:hypothetical protein QKV95_gp071 [Yangshan Harbor Poseidoniales virus]UVF62545.1 hypothetical protein [Poseidoniales virus YSH_150918]
MTTWEWIGLLVFLIIVMLLFFAAFGGSNIDSQNIEEYMENLFEEKNKKANK